MLHFILGRARSGKSIRIFQQMLKALEEEGNKTLILLVPEQLSYETERDLMEAGNLKSLMRLEVLSFQRLAHRVFTQVGRVPGQELNELGRIMLLRHILNTVGPSLRLYQGLAGKEGFLSYLNQLLVEMMRNGITPEDLSFSDVPTILAHKVQDIAFLYRKYMELLTPLLYDREEQFQLLAKKIPGAFFLQNARIWVDGFRGFTGQEYLVLEALLSRVQSMTVALTLDQEGGDPFQPTERTWQRLLQLAKGQKQPVMEEYLSSNYIPFASIQHLERYLYRYPSRPFLKTGSEIQIIEALNPLEEVEEVAREILFLVREKGYRFREVALVTGSRERYQPLIEQVFPEFQIPFFLDAKRSMMESPIIRCILSALRIAMGGFQYEDLFHFLKTGFGPLKRDEWEVLEQYILEWGIQGEGMQETFTYPPSQGALVYLQRLQKTLFQFLLPFSRDLAALEKAAQYTQVLQAFLQRLKLKEQVADWLHYLEEKGQEDYRIQVSQTLEMVEEVFFQLHQLLGDEQMTVQQYYTILESGFCQCELGVIPPTLDQVLVGDLERSRSRTVVALFILGVNDGILPGPNRDQGLFLDGEKELLQEKGLPLVDSFTLAQEERFDLYSLLSRPTGALSFSYALSDSQGQPQEPSLLIKRLQQLFPGVKTHQRDEEAVTSPAHTFHRLMLHLQQYKKEGELSSQWRQVFAWYYQQPEWRDVISHLLQRLYPSGPMKPLGPEGVQNGFPSPLRMSISRLERFLRCPFAHFVAYLLQPLERQEYRVQSFDMGNMMHQALDIFFTQLKERGCKLGEVEESWAWDLMETILQDLGERYHQGLFLQEVRGPYYLRVLKRLGRRIISVVKEQLKRGEFQVAVSEVTFEEGGMIPPLKIILPSRVMYLEGRIDRVDTWEKEGGIVVRVIDYKTGRYQFSLGEAYHGLHLQPLLYLAALLRGGEKLFHSEVIPGGLFYQPILDPLLKKGEGGEDVEAGILKALRLQGLLIGEGDLLLGHDREVGAGERSPVVPLIRKKDGELAKNSRVISPQDLDLFYSHLFQYITEGGGEMLQGVIEPQPVRVNRDSDTTPCRYCDYGAICGFDPSLPNYRYRDVLIKGDGAVLKDLREGEPCRGQNNKSS